MSVPPDQYSCSMCTLLNPLTAAGCTVCGVPNPYYQEKLSEKASKPKKGGKKILKNKKKNITPPPPVVRERLRRSTRTRGGRNNVGNMDNVLPRVREEEEEEEDVVLNGLLGSQIDDDDDNNNDNIREEKKHVEVGDFLQNIGLTQAGKDKGKARNSKNNKKIKNKIDQHHFCDDDDDDASMGEGEERQNEQQQQQQQQQHEEEEEEEEWEPSGKPVGRRGRSRVTRDVKKRAQRGGQRQRTRVRKTIGSAQSSDIGRSLLSLSLSIYIYI